MQIDCVVFDLDGTLIDSATGIERCVREVLAKRGYNKFDGGFLKKSIGVYPIDEIFLRTVRKDEVNECVKEFKQRYARTLTKDTILLDGAYETVNALTNKRYKVAVYTLKMRNHAQKVLEHFSIEVDGMLAGEVIGENKSSGTGLRELVRSLGSEPKRSVMIGDQWTDIAAGKNSGMKTVGILSGFGTFEELNRYAPDYLIGKVSDLLYLLDGISGSRPEKPNRLG